GGHRGWSAFGRPGASGFTGVPGVGRGGPPAKFASAPELVAARECLAASLPVRENVEVRHAERVGPVWRLETSERTVVAASLVVASGFMNVPRRPGFAAALPRSRTQVHTADLPRGPR